MGHVVLEFLHEINRNLNVCACRKVVAKKRQIGGIRDNTIMFDNFFFTAGIKKGRYTADGIGSDRSSMFG